MQSACPVVLANAKIHKASQQWKSIREVLACSPDTTSQSRPIVRSDWCVLQVAPAIEEPLALGNEISKTVRSRGPPTSKLLPRPALQKQRASVSSRVHLSQNSGPQTVTTPDLAQRCVPSPEHHWNTRHHPSSMKLIKLVPAAIAAAQLTASRRLVQQQIAIQLAPPAPSNATPSPAMSPTSMTLFGDPDRYDKLKNNTPPQKKRIPTICSVFAPAHGFPSDSPAIPGLSESPWNPSDPLLRGCRKIRPFQD